jgi:hypothetical protein
MAFEPSIAVLDSCILGVQLRVVNWSRPFLSFAFEPAHRSLHCWTAFDNVIGAQRPPERLGMSGSGQRAHRGAAYLFLVEVRRFTVVLRHWLPMGLLRVASHLRSRSLSRPEGAAAESWKHLVWGFGI